MNSRDHGNGIFYWDVRGGHVFLTQDMKDDCQNINEDYDFFDFILDNNGGYVSRDEFLRWFHSTWRYIPKNMLYETYKELLTDTDWAQGRWAYGYFFKSDLRKDIMQLNKHDTVENPALRSLLDEKGYLTVYHGHCKETMRNSYSWTLNKDNALLLGRTYAYPFLYNSPQFYCVTGKIKLEDVITFISGHNIHEITVMPQKVSTQSKEFFSTKDYNLMQGWTVDAM